MHRIESTAVFDPPELTPVLTHPEVSVPGYLPRDVLECIRRGDEPDRSSEIFRIEEYRNVMQKSAEGIAQIPMEIPIEIGTGVSSKIELEEINEEKKEFVLEGKERNILRYINKLKEHIPNYNKLSNANNCRHFTEECIENAIENAKKDIDVMNCKWPKSTGTTVYRLVESIFSKKST